VFSLLSFKAKLHHDKCHDYLIMRTNKRRNHKDVSLLSKYVSVCVIEWNSKWGPLLQHIYRHHPKAADINSTAVWCLKILLILMHIICEFDPRCFSGPRIRCILNDGATYTWVYTVTNLLLKCQKQIIVFAFYKISYLYGNQQEF